MRRDWMNVGRVHGYSGTPELDAKITKAIAGMKWETLEEGKQFPMMPALGISEAIKQLRMPKASHVALSNQMAPYGFYGIRAHYTNGMVQAYMIDSGTELTPVCVDHWPDEPSAYCADCNQPLEDVHHCGVFFHAAGCGKEAA